MSRFKNFQINDANMNDEGAYRCVATNAAGSATTKSFVRMDGIISLKCFLILISLTKLLLELDQLL